MPLQATSGAASYDGFGGGVPFTPTYIEDVFSTWLYPGNGSTQTITNGIDLSGKGGLVFVKCRNETYNWRAFDSARGFINSLFPNLTDAQNAFTDGGYITATSSTGFTVGQGTHSGVVGVNASGFNYASWTFRKQPKFFDVVTYTGNGSTQNIAHSLGSTPGCIIVKRTNTTGSWRVFHRSVSTQYGNLNSTAAFQTTSAENVWGNNSTTVAPTSTQFTVGNDSSLNASGSTYVAYLFAHNAGGFGLTGTDNVISCGSFTTDGSGNATVSLGYEPQWVLIKQTDGVDSWYLNDNMRGMAVSGNQPNLSPNSSAAESAGGYNTYPNATGFTASVGIASKNYIYIAIRRGPMKTPTTGTSVYENTAYTGNGASNRQIGSSVLTDLLMLNNRDATAQSWSTYAQMFFDRLRGDDVSLATASTNAESTSWGSYMDFDMNAGWDTGPTTGQIYLNKTSSTYVSHIFRRAPGFFDVVCYTGTSTGSRAVTHNLGVAPEMVIVKQRTAVGSNRSWWVLTTSGPRLNILNDASAANAFGVPANLFGDSTYNNYIAPTATTVTLSPSDEVNSSSNSYVMYLFASCPGVSKVFSFTGNGSSQTINCGFTGGARFVMIKRTDSTGDWYVWDTARGIVANNDPHLSLNSTAAEVTTNDTIDTDSTGFVVNQVSATNVNVNGASYIGLAIA